MRAPRGSLSRARRARPLFFSLSAVLPGHACVVVGVTVHSGTAPFSDGPYTSNVELEPRVALSVGSDLVVNNLTEPLVAQLARVSADSDVEVVEHARPERDNRNHQGPLHRRVMTMPKATPKQQLRRDLIDQRLVAFADHLEIFVGTIRANAASSLDGSELTTELGRIRDRAVDLLAHLARQDTSKRRAPTQPTSATDARRSRGPVDAPGKRHRKPQPQERIDKQMGEPRGKQMGQKHFQAGRRSGRG